MHSMFKNTIKKSILAITLSHAIVFSASALVKIADENHEPIDIEKLANAQVFAEFNDKLPAVLNYFTQSSEEDVIEFYENAYGNIVERNAFAGRSTLYFVHNEKQIRVVISTQDNKRQVDILISGQDGN